MEYLLYLRIITQSEIGRVAVRFTIEAYCEDVQDLIRAYTEITSNGKGGKTTKMYVETAKLKFEVCSNIVREKDYQDFEMKFNEVKRVKIRYLPNSNTLLEIEPATG